MQIILTDRQQDTLATACATTPKVRQWRRYRAIHLVAQGQAVVTVARLLACSPASVYNWIAAWRAAETAGLDEGVHAGRMRRLDPAACALLTTLLDSDPQGHGYQTTGWTVPLVRTHLSTAGYVVSERTIRRMIHRLGWRWKRPKYVLGRPDPAYAEKKRP